MKFLVKFELEFDLKFEISDGKNLVKFLGRTFLPARKARKISGRISGQISDQISEKISETSFQISRLFSETSFSRRAVLKDFQSLTCRNFDQLATRTLTRMLMCFEDSSLFSLICSPVLLVACLASPKTAIADSPQRLRTRRPPTALKTVTSLNKEPRLLHFPFS